MAEYEVTVRREVEGTYRVNARDEDGATEKVQALIDKDPDKFFNEKLEIDSDEFNAEDAEELD